MNPEDDGVASFRGDDVELIATATAPAMLVVSRAC